MVNFPPHLSISNQHLMIDGQYHNYLYGGIFVGPAWAAFMREALADEPVEQFEDVFRE